MGEPTRVPLENLVFVPSRPRASIPFSRLIAHVLSVKPALHREDHLCIAIISNRQVIKVRRHLFAPHRKGAHAELFDEPDMRTNLIFSLHH